MEEDGASTVASSSTVGNESVGLPTRISPLTISRLLLLGKRSRKAVAEEGDGADDDGARGALNARYLSQVLRISMRQAGETAQDPPPTPPPTVSQCSPTPRARSISRQAEELVFFADLDRFHTSESGSFRGDMAEAEAEEPTVDLFEFYKLITGWSEGGA